MRNLTLEIQFLGYWYIGTGNEAGAYADSILAKDLDGLPYVPGKTLKGMVRQACEIAQGNGWFDNFSNVIECIFGQEGSAIVENKISSFSDNSNLTELDVQGCMYFSNAEFSDEDKKDLNNNPTYKNYLYETIQSTKIDRETGVAEPSSLRSAEVCIPVNLYAELNYDESKLPASVKPQDFEKTLDSALALITEIGGKRRRGFGRCKVGIV